MGEKGVVCYQMGKKNLKQPYLPREEEEIFTIKIIVIPQILTREIHIHET